MSGVVTSTIVAVGVSEATAGAIAAFAVPMLTSAAIGAVGSAIMGGDPLTGALTGAIGGGFGAVGGLAGGALGIGADAGGALFGAAGGALGAGITGGNPLMGAVTGGAGGLFGQMAQNGDLSSIFGGDSSASGVDPTTGANTGAGPTVAAANQLDPNSLNQMAAASNNSSLPGLSANPSDQLLSPPNASSSLFSTNPGGIDPTTGLNTGVGPTVSNATSLAPAASTPSTSSWNSLSDNPISNALFGSGTPSTPATTQTAQQAMDKMNSTGQAQMFTQGGQTYMLNTDGTPTAIGKTGDTGALGGLAGKGLSGILSNPLQSALLGTQLYSMSQAPALPTLAQQQASAQGPTFSANLPQYKATQTRNPIADYYTYGYSPQPTQISTALAPVPAGTQGTGNAPIQLAGGGFAHPRLPGAPHLPGAPRRNAGAGAAMLGALSHIRRANGIAPVAPMGGALSAVPPMMAHGGLFARQGQVQMGTGTKGQADKVPAMLSEQEYVVPADVVSGLGDGSSDAGGGVLDRFVSNVRAHKSKLHSDGMPPKAKSPERYLRRA